MPYCLSDIIPLYFHRLFLKLLDIQVVVKGRQSDYAPTIFISNHLSWVDIPVLGSILKGHFIAKNDIASWPVFGYLAKLQNTIFVSRTQRNQVKQQMNSISDYLAQKRNIILFAEGTTNDGNKILPFKSSLFSVTVPTEDYIPAVQPVSICYYQHYGMPLERMKRAIVAWYGDMTMMGHLKDLLSFGPVKVLITFDEPVFYQHFKSRKAMASYIEDRVRLGYINSYNQ